MESRNGVGRSKAGDWRRYQRVLLPPIRDLHKLEVYEEHGGYSALRDVLTGGTWDQKSVINEVKESGLRGRGGAGVVTSQKLSIMPPDDHGVTRYLHCNRYRDELGT